MRNYSSGFDYSTDLQEIIVAISAIIPSLLLAVYSAAKLFNTPI